MASELYDWLRRFKGVELEHRAAKLATDRLLAAVADGTVSLDEKGLEVRHVLRMAERLEATYHVRIYAEFENALRIAWRAVYRRRTRPVMEVLIDRIGVLAGIPGELIQAVHEVRDHRNMLIHEDARVVTALGLDQARNRLCNYFSRLSTDWKE